MVSKIYFWVIAFIILFTIYYQYIITANYRLFDILQTGLQLLLLLGGYVYFFKVKILTPKNWKFIYKVLIGNIILNLIIQILPSSYRGDFSFLNNGFLVNIFAYLASLIIFIPLYIATYKLAYNQTK